MSIRIATSLRSDLAEAAAKLKFSEPDTMRLAMEIGIKHFRAIDYDLAGAVLNQAGITPKLQPQPVKHTGPIATDATSPSNITPMPQLDIAAETPHADDDEALPPAKKVSYGSGKSRKKKSG